MSALSVLYPTLADVQATLTPDGKVASDIIEILKPVDECLDDFVWLPTNNKMSHKTTTRTGMPDPTWRKLYGFTQPSKASVEQVTDTCGILTALSHLDVDLAELSGNPRQVRRNEDMAKVITFKKKLANATFYSNEATEPEAITGLSPRFDDSSGPENDENIIKGANGTPDTSIWLCVWGPDTGHHLYPEGTNAGLSMMDDGIITDTNGSGGYRKMYQTEFKWKLGLSIRDWRYFVRIQVDSGEITKTHSDTNKEDLIDLMTQALELPPNLVAGRTAFYCNRTIKSFLRRQIANKVAASTLTMETVMGRHVMTFDGIPVRRCDALHSNETAVA